ncbi:hypothetical protein RBA29_003381 [Cronobacter turicensis]|nr:hypothetical protein [Cronobacter turicensis]EKY3212897.1 hypothetical protein [Cronobacter turicensis]EKY3216301.1 hypothetical protein [Cronobacter turicensis]
MITVSKALKWCTLVFIIVFILGGIVIWFVAANVDETVIYTESDFFNYHALTDKDIENAPRITHDYYFEAHPGDGYAPTNSIIFKAANGTAPLRSYLESMGYKKEKRSLGDKEIWSKLDQANGDLFYLYFNTATGEVELTKVLNN